MKKYYISSTVAHELMELHFPFCEAENMIFLELISYFAQNRKNWLVSAIVEKDQAL